MKKARVKSPGQRPQRSARKLDRKAALEQRARGLSNKEIAGLQDVATSTVRRFLDRMEPERAAVEEFKSGRADALARIQGKALDLQERLIDSIDDGVLQTLLPHQKNGLLVSVNTVFGTAYDKERMERGKSTQNVGVLARIMGKALDTAYKGSDASVQSEEFEDSTAE